MQSELIGRDLLAIHPTTSHLNLSNNLDHLLARIGVRRMQHRIEPGLYSLGNPTPDSPVFVSANYTLSFDALRSSLTGIGGYILVIDTQGVNVWCAAGEGTFGTDELVSKVKSTGLSNVVSHRTLVLPQLGAPGVAAHEVRKRTGFKVEYGPVRAADLPVYLKDHRATPEMRLAKFGLGDRLVVALVDVFQALLPAVVVALILYIAGGWIWPLAAVTVVLAGMLLFPVLLPWLPTHDFSTKGFILGVLVALPFAAEAFFGHPQAAGWLRIGSALAPLLSMAPAIAFLALLFTGSTTFTSRSGVKREIAAYIPIMAWSFGAGVLLVILSIVARLAGALK